MTKSHVCLAGILGLFALEMAAPVEKDEKELIRQIEVLADHYGYLGLSAPRTPDKGTVAEAVRVLREAGLSSLEVFGKHFGQIDYRGRGVFRAIVPHLPQAETDEWLLAEFRKGLPLYLHVEDLRARLNAGEVTKDLAVEYERLRPDIEWVEWVIRAKPDAGFISSYEEARDVFLKQNEDEGPANDFADAMFRIDADRAMADFGRLVKEPDVRSQLKGVRGFMRVRRQRLPDREVWQQIFERCAPRAQEQADNLILYVEREDVGRILLLVGHPVKGVGWMAEYRLSRMGHLTRKQLLQVRAKQEGWTPEQRVAWWTDWWNERRNLSDDALAEKGAQALVAEIGEEPAKDALVELLEYPDHPGIYPVLAKALASSDSDLREEASGQLGNLAAMGQVAAVDVVLTHTEGLSPAEAFPFLARVARSKDPRVADRLFGLVEAILEAASEDVHESPRNLAGTLASTGDPRALDVVFQILMETGDQLVARTLVQIDGSERKLPELLDALVHEKNGNRRFAIRTAIEHLGDSSVAPRLTQLLAIAEPGEGFNQGSRSDVLRLMEIFPDPAAKPVLLKLLQSEDPWAHLYAARVLGRLGDYSGVPQLIEDLQSKARVSAHFNDHDMGQALKDIAAPDTKPQLLAFFERATGEVRRRAFDVIAQQEDPAYLSFFECLIEDGDKKIASRVPSAIVRCVMPRTEEGERQRLVVREEYLEPVRSMLAWAFFGEKMRPEDPAFPVAEGLKVAKGAVVTVNPWQAIQFKADNRATTLVDLKRDEKPVAPDGSSPGHNGPFVVGTLDCSQAGEYLLVSLRLDHDGMGYLFRRDGAEWQPIGRWMP
jgi:HEAT repeat protein